MTRYTHAALASLAALGLLFTSPVSARPGKAGPEFSPTAEMQAVHSLKKQIAAEELARRDVGTPTPYYSLHFTPPGAGVYTSVMTQGDLTTEHMFRVGEPGSTDVPQPGDILPAIATATSTQSRIGASGVFDSRSALARSSATASSWPRSPTSTST